MEEISRKNEKFSGTKGKSQNKESRGESPVRKNSNISNSFTQQKSNTVNSLKPGSGNSGMRIKSQRVDSTNLVINEGYNQGFKRPERPNSFCKLSNINNNQVRA
jgi:hypothetical protein